MQVPDLRLVLQGGLAARAPGKHLRQPFEQLPLPCGHLVRMKLVPRRDRLHAVPLAQRLERYPCLELRREPPSLPGHLGASSAALESTLTTCPKNRDHLTRMWYHSWGQVTGARRDRAALWTSLEPDADPRWPPPWWPTSRRPRHRSWRVGPGTGQSSGPGRG